MNLKWNNGYKKVYWCFVDFKAAFDRMNRKELIYKLDICRVSGKFVKIV